MDADECRDYFLSCNIVPNASAVLVRRTIYERVGGADESLRMAGDWKLWASMALTGRIAYLGEPLNYYRFHDDTVRDRDKSLVVGAEEGLHVIRWMQDQITITDSMREKSCELLSGGWIPPVLNGHVPLERRWAILRSAMAIDPRALRRLVRGWFKAAIGDTIRGALLASRAERHSPSSTCSRVAARKCQAIIEEVNKARHGFPVHLGRNERFQWAKPSCQKPLKASSARPS